MTATVLSKPDVTRLGDAVQFSWPAIGVRVELDRFRESHDEISAEVLIFSDPPLGQGLLNSSKLNLMSNTTRASLARSLSEKERDVPWAKVLESVCFHGVQMYRDGEPSIALRDVDPWANTRWLLYPYLEYGGPTVLYAEGGSGKSVLAMWMALRVALNNIPVLYLDYETSAEVHAERLTALYAGMGYDMAACPDVYYRRMFQSLSQASASLRKEIARLKVGLVIVDSLGMAGDGPPEESATAINLAQALRSLGVPTLGIHHKRKGNGMDKQNQRDRLFGSVYYLNFARLVWEVEAAQSEDADATDVALTNVKRNNGRLLKRHALSMRFYNESADGQQDERLVKIVVRKQDLSDVPEFADKMTLRERVQLVLDGGAMKTVEEIAAELGDDKSTVKPMMSRMLKAGEVVNIDHKWALRAR